MSSPNSVQVLASRNMKWAIRVARMGEKRNAYRVLVRKSEGKSNLEDLGILGDNIKIHLKCIGWKIVDRIDVTDYREKWLAVVNTVMNLSVSIKREEVLE